MKIEFHKLHFLKMPMCCPIPGKIKYKCNAPHPNLGCGGHFSSFLLSPTSVVYTSEYMPTESYLRV